MPTNPTVPDDGVLAPPGASATNVLQASVRMRRSTVNLSGAAPSKAACGIERSGLVVGGRGRTNATGRWTFPYGKKTLCGIGEFNPDGVLVLRPEVVATAHGTSPAIVTQQVTGTDSEFVIEIRSFDMTGAPLAGVTFSWHAISLTQFVVG